jgi:ribosomal protein S20
LTDEQEAAYRTNLKKVITHPNADVEAALEAFADANLDLTAAVIDVNKSIG